MHFSDRLRELFAHSSEEETRIEDVELLRLGRHFRIRPDLKIVVGRDREENERLERFEGPGRWRLAPHGFSGPSALVCGPRDSESLGRAAELIVRHAKAIPAGALLEWREGGLDGRMALSELAATALDSARLPRTT